VNKFRAGKTIVEGMKFDSKKESERYKVLRKMQEEGQITELQRQVKYVLIPTQRSHTELDKYGKFKVLEREVYYKADFVYRDKDGKLHVEDTKGCKKGSGYEVFVIKRKLMLKVHGIRIEEV
jgi:D-alanine-D-alanine ligase-like ATP-grasp enzyme